MSKPEGYRYVRQYWTKRGNQNWALYEQRDGRARRVGTVRYWEDYMRFLGLDPSQFPETGKLHAAR